mmetsp:Transcript_67814/g.120174  ORF Transcript_67814/g.120174 Transcript_67814/m.120174 type:complete len:95 (-) Transcript_67814:693-977(-)
MSIVQTPLVVWGLVTYRPSGRKIAWSPGSGSQFVAPIQTDQFVVNGSGILTHMMVRCVAPPRMMMADASLGPFLTLWRLQLVVHLTHLCARCKS